jgi:hypothetical protein
MIHRRAFLRSLSLGACIAAMELALPSVSYGLPSGPLAEGVWIFDALYGVYRNPVLSNAILCRKGIMLEQPAEDRGWRNSEFRERGYSEYGWFTQLYNQNITTSADLCMRAAAPLDEFRDIIRWATIELRATVPVDFGRTRIVAWYGWGKEV